MVSALQKNKKKNKLLYITDLHYSWKKKKSIQILHPLAWIYEFTIEWGIRPPKPHPDCSVNREDNILDKVDP